MPGKLVGSVAGAMNSIGAASSIIAPIVTGIIVKVTGSFQMAFTLGGCAMLVAAILTLFAVPVLALQETLSAQELPVPAVEEVKA